MDDFTILMILVLVIAPLMSVLWWGFVLYAAYRYFRQFDQHLKTAETLGHQWQAASVEQRGAVQAAWWDALVKMNQSYGQLKGIQRQRADTQRAEVMGMAASAGFTNF